VRQLNQQGARVGDGRKARFRDQAGIFRAQLLRIGLDLFPRGMLVELQQRKLVDMALVPSCRQETPGRAQLLDEEEPKRRDPVKDGLREGVLRGEVAQRRRDQVEFAFHRS